MYDFIRVACAVPPVSVGDPSANVQAMFEKVKAAQEKNVDIVVFPELCVTGYTCGDLFFQDALQKSAVDAILLLLKQTETLPVTILFGAPLLLEGQLFNCAIGARRGKIFGIVPKIFIPNYNEFYEKRWFSSALECKETSVQSTVAFPGIGADYPIPVGSGLVFDLGHKVKFGMEICEDLWAPIPPSSYLCVGGAELIFNLSASNETITKRAYCGAMAKQQSASLIGGYVYCSAGCDESTTDLVFSGHSIICENGAVLNENKTLIDNDYLLCSDIDLGRLRADRIKIKTFKDSAQILPHECHIIPVPFENETFSGDGTLYHIKKYPFVPASKTDRERRCKDIFDMQVFGLRKRLLVTGAKPVVGVSGGLDSTLALLVCVQAMKALNRPLTDVTGITMPCFGTTDRTYQNALELMRALGVTTKEINIKSACEQHFKDIGQNPDTHDTTYENVQARERTQVLMDYAGKTGGLVVGTGDLSELALGWCTYNADHMSMYNVNGSVPKTLVKWMIDSVVAFDLFPAATPVLKDVIDTPISPELLPPDEKGNIAQQTEDIVGPYALHDFFLYHMLRFGFAPDKIYYLAKLAFADEFEPPVILKWLKTFYKRFFSQQFKRSCLPDGVKVGSVCLSPRGDWRMPSDASAKIWLDSLEQL